jgi:hypothetical protein
MGRRRRHGWYGNFSWGFSSIRGRFTPPCQTSHLIPSISWGWMPGLATPMDLRDTAPEMEGSSPGWVAMG